MPLTHDASANIAELTRVHGGEKDWPRKRIIAAGMNAARRRGGRTASPRSSHRSRRTRR